LQTSPLPADVTNTEDVEHHRLADYKAKGKPDQQRRREEQLQRQKHKRGNLADLARKLANDHIGDETNALDTPVVAQESMEVVRLSKEEREKQQEDRRAAFYRSQLMLPEYMQDVPSDLFGNWFVVPCPATPQKCLVIASGGVTTSRLASGILLNKFSSNLPGGSRAQGGPKNSFTILDCIYHPDTQTYFVLDLMAWRGCLYYDCATDFRIFWMNSKLSEVTCHTVSTDNPFRFVPLPFYECDFDGLRAAVEGPFPVAREGLFFYNKQTQYTFGTTPLLCYLSIDVVPQFVTALQQFQQQSLQQTHPQNLTQQVQHQQMQ